MWGHATHCILQQRVRPQFDKVWQPDACPAQPSHSPQHVPLMLACVQVGSTLFVHGGVLPSHVEYGLERINAETRAWLLGQDPSTVTTSSSSSNPFARWAAGGSSAAGGNTSKRYPPPAFLRGADAVVWAR
jgi:hypothetical protein